MLSVAAVSVGVPVSCWCFSLWCISHLNLHLPDCCCHISSRQCPQLLLHLSGTCCHLSAVAKFTRQFVIPVGQLLLCLPGKLHVLSIVSPCFMIALVRATSPSRCYFYDCLWALWLSKIIDGFRCSSPFRFCCLSVEFISVWLLFLPFQPLFHVTWGCLLPL